MLEAPKNSGLFCLHAGFFHYNVPFGNQPDFFAADAVIVLGRVSMGKSNAVPLSRLGSRVLVSVLFAALPMTAVQAIQFELDYGEGISGSLNTSATLGAAMRMQHRSSDLLGKANLVPSLCGTRTVAARGGEQINFNSCQGINQNDILPAQALSGISEDIGAGPLDGIGNIGQFTPNADNGNWNYERYDLIQAPLKVTQDLSMTYDDYGFFGRWLYFYDFVNNDFQEYHPNRLQAGSPALEGPALAYPGAPNTYGGAEAPFYDQRTDPEVLRQIGSDFQLMDAYVYGYAPLPGDRELTLKLGRQSLSWGESTLLVINSVNQSNPVNANNLFRTGFVPEEVFTPVGMLYASTGITDNLSIEAYYQYEWDPVEAPAAGGFFSTVDVGTNNSGGDIASISFGGPAEDPQRVGTPLNNPLSGLTDSTTSILRRRDNEASDSGQFGVAFKYFAEDFNNGTDFGFYFMNYHSKLPFGSFFASDLSCARTHPADGADGDATGSNNGVDAFNTGTLALACPNLPLADALGSALMADQVLDSVGGPLSDVSAQLGGLTGIEEGLQLLGSGPVTDAVPLDTVEFQLEYPENLKLYGISFNTTAGDLSIQGEVAYRPNMPVQVDAEDLTFAALGPTLTSCHRVLHPDYGGNVCEDSSGQLSQSGENTFNLIPPEGSNSTGNGGDAPSVQRSYPAFITSYRGITLGENDPNGYIRGWEHVKALQYNLGATYILGKTDNPIGADQVIMFFEVGASHILNMPENHLYQIEAPATFRHASAGVVDQDALAPVDESSTQAEWEAARMSAPGCFPGICVAGTDGMRFNPQQETNSYTDGFSWGYRVIGILRYESIAPGISLQPFIIMAHDVKGIAPGPGENFIEGRKNFIINFEIRYKNNWAFFPGYAWWTGGGSQNLLRDRDFSQFYVRYQF